MHYEQLTKDNRIAELTARLGNLEREHYGLVLNKLANAGNAAAVQQIEQQIELIEQAIDNLRGEREREQTEAAATPAPPPELVDEPAPAT